MRKYSGATDSGKTGAMTLDLYRAWMNARIEGKLKWAVAAYPHPFWAMRLAAQLYHDLGERRFLQFVRVERIGDMDKVRMVRFVPYSENCDPWARMQEDTELLGATKNMIARRRKIEFTERPILNKGAVIGGRCQQDLNRNKDVFFPECNLPFLFAKDNPEREARLLYTTDPEVRAALEKFGRMSPHDEINILEPMGRLWEELLRSPAIMARTTRRPTIDRAKFLQAGGFEILIGGNCSDDELQTYFGSHFVQTMFYLRSFRVTTQGYYASDEVNNYGLYGEFESKCLSTMRAFAGEDSLWHAVQSDDYPTPEIARNVNQNCDLYVFRQGDDEEAMKTSKLLMGLLDRMREHHRDVIRRQVHAGFDEVERRTKAVAHDEHGAKTGHTEQVGTQLVAKYDEETQEKVVYESGNEQLLWQARDLTLLPQRHCIVRRVNRVPYPRVVDWFPDSWEFQGDPERGIQPLWRKKFDHLLARLKELPEYQTPVLIPVPVPVPKPPKPRKPAAKPPARGKGAAAKLDAKGKGK